MANQETDCWADDLRTWHNGVLERYYKGTKAYFELLQGRENWMNSMKIVCCKGEEE